MGKKMIFLLVLVLCFISACDLIEMERDEEEEKAVLYENEFQDKSENWEVKLHLQDEPIGNIYLEGSIFTIKYLKEIDGSLVFKYEWVFGAPERYRITMNDDAILTQDQDEFKTGSDQRRIIEEVCFDQFTLEIIWNDAEGDAQEESFVFKDNENPQCENYDPVISANR